MLSRNAEPCIILIYKHRYLYINYVQAYLQIYFFDLFAGIPVPSETLRVLGKQLIERGHHTFPDHEIYRRPHNMIAVIRRN